MVNLQPNPRFRADAACVLGSTGSVGTQTLDVLREMNVPVVMMTAGENTALFAEQIREFSPRIAAVLTEEAARELTGILTERGIPLPEILWHGGEILDAVRQTEADIIFHSISGLAGLPSALAAANSGKRVAMANKEAIIACGELIFQRLAASGGELIPVDSEHSAIYRCLEGHDIRDVNRLLLTASGGPFYGKTVEELSSVTAAEALAHPTWKMGKKITVDSATLMNKGFEIIEAVRLFGIPEDRVKVLIHRQSIVHSMVEWADRTVYAEMGRPDMRDCIRGHRDRLRQGRLQGPGRGRVPDRPRRHPPAGLRGHGFPDLRGAGHGDLPPAGRRPGSHPHRGHRACRTYRGGRGGGGGLPPGRDRIHRSFILCG